MRLEQVIFKFIQPNLSKWATNEVVVIFYEDKMENGSLWWIVIKASSVNTPWYISSDFEKTRFLDET